MESKIMNWLYEWFSIAYHMQK